MKYVSALTAVVCLGAALQAASPVPRPATDFRCPEDVLGYLGVSVLERLMVPQIMIIDRGGQVLAQSAAQARRSFRTRRTFAG